MKTCSECSHAMLNPNPDELFCIEGPPTPILCPDGAVRSFFPVLLVSGKCDKFKTGKPQEQNKHKEAPMLTLVPGTTQ